VAQQEPPGRPPGSGADELQALRERRFITVVSHQLKAPLVAARQYLDLLHQDAQARPEAAHTRPWIDRSAVRLDEALALVEDWLALARVDAGALVQPDAITALAPLLEGLAEGAREDAAASRLGVSLELAPEPLLVRGDRSGLRAALSHITDNAVRYNRPGGSVTIRAEARPPLACVEVIDTGIGIPAAFLPELFQEFQRSGSQASKDIPGTGLGLAISSRIVAQLGGRIEVESTEGEGSCFRVLLPLVEPPADGA
jgi:two-component system phosphate regulon sensor histidine kinase PhoR